MTGPDETDAPYPNSWFVTMSRVEANMPTETERRAAEYLYNRGWVDQNLSTEDRNRARQTFVNGMRTGFKDRSYNFNWTVWRTEYERTGYPPGSFDPRPDPGYQDPSVFQGTGPTPEQDYIIKKQSQQSSKGVRGFGNPNAPKGNTQRGFGESERKYQKRMQGEQTEWTNPTSRSPHADANKTNRRFGESERAYRKRMEGN